MTPPRARRSIAGLTTLGLLTAAAPLLAGLAATSAEASIKTTTVPFTRCDVRTTGNDPSTRVGPVFAWSPTVTVDLPSPVRTNEYVTGRVTISAFPAGKIPVSIPAPYTYFTGAIGTSNGGTSFFGKTIRTPHVVTEPIALGETEDDYWFNKPGVVSWFAHDFTMSVEGWDGPNNTGNWHRYYVKCDKPTAPPLIASTPVWDPAAKAAAGLSSSRIAQGGRIRVDGTGFRPDEAVRVAVDRTTLTTKATSLIGSVSHTWTAGPWLAPGTHSFTLTSTISAKTVTRSFTVVPASAKASFTPKSVKRGKKTTITGSRFKPGEKVKIVLRRTSSGKGLKSKTIGTYTATSAGVVKKKFAVSKKFAKGKHRITLTGSSSRRVATANLTVKK